MSGSDRNADLNVRIEAVARWCESATPEAGFSPGRIVAYEVRLLQAMAVGSQDPAEQVAGMKAVHDADHLGLSMLWCPWCYPPPDPTRTSSRAAKLCGSDGGRGIGAGHVCRCESVAGHAPLTAGRPHGCSCGALWADSPERAS